MGVEKSVGKKMIRAVRGDITGMEVEAFVYDITEDVQLGTGYGGAITARAGKVVQDQLDEIGRCPTGQAVITSAGEMPVKRIIHVNGPKFHEPGQEEKLRSAIQSALDLARDEGLAQIAFPPVGTGFYQVDLGMCTRLLAELAREHLEGETSIEEILLVGLDEREMGAIESALDKEG